MEGENKYKKGLWSPDEDSVLLDFVSAHGAGRWRQVSKLTGLKRNAKSCRTRWVYQLSPNVKHGDFSEEEDDLIIRLHNLLGNRWSLIAGRLPGRTDNQVKNNWNSHLSKKLGIKKQNGKVVVSSSETHSSLEVAGGQHKHRDMEVMKNDQEPLVAGGDHDSNEERRLMSEHSADSLSCSDGNLVSWGMVELLQGYPSSPVVASKDNFLF